MDDARVIRTLALREVVSERPTPEYQLRHIQRWYSKQFHTPLHMVEELPLDDVLQHYYEAWYETLASAEEGELRLKFEDELKELAMTPEELARHRTKEDLRRYDDEKWHQEVAAEAAAQAAADLAKALAKPAAPPAGPMIPKAKPKAAPQPAPPVVIEEDAEFSLQFIDLDEIGESAELDGIRPLSEMGEGPPPGPRKPRLPSRR